MRKLELIENRRKLLKVQNRYSVLFFVVFFALSGCASWLRNCLSESNRLAHLVFTSIPFSVLFFGAPFFLWYFFRAPKKHGLICPSCGARLHGSLGQVAVATGICGDCGKKIIDD